MQSALSAESWRKRAQEARHDAEQMLDSAAKGLMLQIADNYDKIAEVTEHRRSGRAWSKG